MSAPWPAGQRAVLAQAHAHLADGVHALGDRLDRELLELGLHLHQRVDGPIGRVDRAVADGDRLVARAIAQQHAHRRGGAQVGAATDLEVLEPERLLAALALVGDDRLEIAVGDVTLAVGELLEPDEGALQLLAVEAVAQLLETVAQRMTSAQLAQHQRGPGARPDPVP